MPNKAKDLVGQRFGNWTVLKRGKNVKGRVYWICECDCGTVRSVFGDSLKSGRSTSCGCNRKGPRKVPHNTGSEIENMNGDDGMPNNKKDNSTFNDAGLRECPFCGCNKAQVAESDDRHRPNVVCPVCGVRVYGDTEYLAVLRWNMRLGEN